ncbi:MAG: peptidoglycan recognition protein, partial [Thermoleophilia bacterium]|nr:peptidoglycan recognition protein [Thermoleophilia bacterium]
MELRTRSLAGRWSPWRPAAPEPEDGPDPGSPEASTGWRVGNPWWVGPSNALQVRVRGEGVAQVRAHLVWSPEVRVPLRSPAAVGMPPIVPRAVWGADEAIRRAPPVYAPTLRLAIVHHTAGRNDYTRAEAPAIVRAIQLFHVEGNGWNDIGYNFLVDRFGTIYEGRFGGIDRNVVGAHAMGFNTGSVGIALLGSYGETAPSAAAREALARLLAWRLDVAHLDPTGVLTVLSGGNERYARGLPVTLRAVSGHRDVGSTACPGDELYRQLDELARTARRTGGDKVFEPTVETSGQTHRFRARLSSALPWSVIVRDPDGAEVARGAGRGVSVDWTWEATAVPPATYGWTITAGSARSATGSLRAGAPATVGLEEVALEPSAISPNGDG